MDKKQRWQEPKKRDGGPSMTAKAVAAALGFTSVESVHLLVRRGPDKGGLAGYIPNADGVGWTRKRGSGNSGVEVMFYPEDIAQWERDHPILEKNKAPVFYTPEEKEIVLSMASKLESEAGHVVRTELMKRLATQYGSKTWNTRSYKKIKAILDDAGISLPPQMPRDTTPRRKYSGRQTRAS